MFRLWQHTWFGACFPDIVANAHCDMQKFEHLILSNMFQLLTHLTKCTNSGKYETYRDIQQSK